MVNDIIGIFMFISIVAWIGNFVFTKEVLRTRTIKGKFSLRYFLFSSTSSRTDL